MHLRILFSVTVLALASACSTVKGHWEFEGPAPAGLNPDCVAKGILDNTRLKSARNARLDTAWKSSESWTLARAQQYPDDSSFAWLRLTSDGKQLTATARHYSGDCHTNVGNAPHDENCAPGSRAAAKWRELVESDRTALLRFFQESAVACGLSLTTDAWVLKQSPEVASK